MRSVLLLAIVVTAVAGAVTIAAGGVDEKKDKTATAATGGTEATVPETTSLSDQEAARAHIGATVRMRRLAFKPTTVTIRQGESVRWVNHDNVLHNVTATTGSGTELAAFKSKSIPPLSTYVTAPAPGTYLYVCTIHPTVMHGKVIVLRS